MLEKVDLTKKLSKAEYKARMPVLRNKLYDLEKACWDAGIPSVILFEGWDAAGKGTSINLLTQLHLPWLWRFWLKLPDYGEMAIFDRSWYGRVLVERVEGLTPEEEWRKGYRDIVDFERTIADDGYVVIKFYLHISKKEQARRFKKLEKDPLESWHVQSEDWEHHRKYDAYLIAIEEMLERTDTEWGPWTIVEATDRRWARVKIFETIIHRLEEALQGQGLSLPVGRPGREESPAAAGEEGEGTPLAVMGLSNRVLAALEQAGLATAEDLVEWSARGDTALLELAGIGPKGLDEIKQRIAALVLVSVDPESEAQGRQEVPRRQEEV
jgi:polyphosphate kinase 2 (PPK2 family)